MFQKLFNVFRIPDLRNKLFFTLALLAVYRIGFYVPLPGVNAPYLRELATHGAKDNFFAQLSNFFSVFSVGDLSQGTMFGLGIMPYISASIILQLLGTVMPALEKLRKEGEPGVRKINEWTRYITVAVCVVQATMYILHFNSAGAQESLYLPASADGAYHGYFMVLSVVALTAGSVFLMWLGEQIEQFGVGNGVSLIITAGIVARMPDAVNIVLQGCISSQTLADGKEKGNWAYVQGIFRDVFSPSSGAHINILHILFLAACFIFVVGAAIFLTQAQRRIPVQQAKNIRGRRIYGGQKQYLPLRVNHSGVMPIIFASTLVSLPIMGLGKLGEWLGAGGPNFWSNSIRGFTDMFGNGGYLYESSYCVMIFFFAYFWNTVQFQPKEMANQLRDYGSFIPGLRPGKRTADYLENVMSRITYVGAAFLCVIAIIPSVISALLLKDALGDPNKAMQVTQFLGGTGLLIVISVMLDFMNRIEANLVMRNYSGFLDDEGEGPTKIKRAKTPEGRGPA